MRVTQIEAWTLDVIERVKRRQHIEDSRVELKAEWPNDARRCARQLAGHANASRGAQLLWLIGVDERNGLVGAEVNDFGAWWRAVAKHFDELPPAHHAYAVPVDGRSVVAVLFDTDRVPHAVRNPKFSREADECIEWEVPWRDASATRSARRSDLLRLLSPIVQLPDLAFVAGKFSLFPAQGGARERFDLKIQLYVEARTEALLVVPFYRCRGEFAFGEGEFRDLRRLTIKPSMGSRPMQTGNRFAPSFLEEYTNSRTIDASDTEVLIRGPGMLFVEAAADPSGFDADCQDRVTIRIVLPIVHSDLPLGIQCSLPRLKNKAIPVWGIDEEA